MPEYLCPFCGKWQPNLIKETGWCGYCTAEIKGKYAYKCQECGNVRVVTSRSDSTRKVCTTCRWKKSPHNKKNHRKKPTDEFWYLRKREGPL